MKIRKSRLKEIIKEEVANFKFIDISESILDGSAATEEAEADEEEAEANESTRLLDEIVVQEIIKALGEGPLSHTHQAQALQKKAKTQGSLGHNDAAALKYHLAQSEKEQATLAEDDDWLGDVKSTGEWTDYTVAELEKKKAALMKKDERDADEVETVRQLNFAIRAKKGELSEEERT